MEKIKLSLDVVNQNNHSDLGVELWIDKNKFFDSKVAPGVHRIVTMIDDDEKNHILNFVLKDKNHHHTQVDKEGAILQDSLIHFKNICFDDIDVDLLVHSAALYTHTSNGTSTEVEERFHGTMGCNGQVSLEFFTPIHLWILENM